MPNTTLPPDVVALINKVAGDDPILRLYEFQIPVPGAYVRLRLVSNPVDVEFRGNTYHPAPVNHGEVVYDSESNLPTVRVELSAVNREVVELLEAYHGLSGQPVKLLTVARSQLVTNSALIEEDWQVIYPEYNATSVTMVLGRFNFQQAAIPKTKLSATSCRRAYRGPKCGYYGAIAGCDKTLDGANGCTAHGADSAEHPKRWGGYSSLPRTSGLGASG